MRRRLAFLVAVGAALTVLGMGLAAGASAKGDELSAVRSLTARFQSVKQAEKAGYAPFYVCTEQPGVGTMGQHFVKGTLVDGVADPTQPEALVYEPTANGGYRLVALEWVIPSFGTPRSATPPTIFGIPMNWRPGAENTENLPPNRFGLPNFYELHYWLYKSNPLGSFNDWNPNVSCRGNGDNGG
jgi:hypothetical protein